MLGPRPDEGPGPLTNLLDDINWRSPKLNKMLGHGWEIKSLVNLNTDIWLKASEFHDSVVQKTRSLED